MVPGRAKDKHPAAADLRQQLRRIRLLHEQRASGSEQRHARLRLVQWQSDRLGRTYADLAANPRYKRAVDFFMDELYGPRDFSRRDHDLERVSPLVVRLLPGKVVGTVARAVELNALSQELDNRLLDRLLDDGCDFDRLDERVYARAYRNCGNEASRRLQIELTRLLGEDLDRVVRKPLIRRALVMMRPAAEVAGFGELQKFLEFGFTAFRDMNGATEFLDVVIGRERLILERIFAGNPSPFDLAA